MSSPRANRTAYPELSASSKPSRSGKPRKRRTLRRALAEYSLLFLAIYLGGCLALAWNTVKPKLGRHVVTPAAYNLKYEAISFRSADDTRLAGWLMPAKGRANGTVILCHGVDSTMKDMLWKAGVFHKAGFHTLVFDFRGRGESGGSLCTIGYRETDDLLAAVDYVQSRPELKAGPIGVFGESQGGAVALMGAARCSHIAAVVAESSFARLDHAVDNHFRSVFGATGAFLATPVRWFGEAMIHCRCSHISPMDEVTKIAPRPILIVSDEEDSLCPQSEARALLAAARGPKEIWSVPGADHICAESVAPSEFTQRITGFFLKNLKR